MAEYPVYPIFKATPNTLVIWENRELCKIINTSHYYADVSVSIGFENAKRAFTETPANHITTVEGKVRFDLLIAHYKRLRFNVILFPWAPQYCRPMDN